MKLLIALLIVLAIGVALRIAMPKLGSDASGGVVNLNDKPQLADCPDTPNCVCSEASRGPQQIAALPIDGDASTAITRLAALIGTMPGTHIVKQDGRYLHATFQTRWAGFIDDVEFLLDESAQSIQVRSASRLGHSDLGANAKRVEMLRSAFAATAS